MDMLLVSQDVFARNNASHTVGNNPKRAIRVLFEQLADFKLQILCDTQNARAIFEATNVVKGNDVRRFRFSQISSNLFWKHEVRGWIRPRRFGISA
jgi:hypothetical protein